MNKKLIRKILSCVLSLIIGGGIMSFNGCVNKTPKIATDYAFNQGDDLKNLSYARLPIGSIKPKGHLYERLRAQADNITYDMYELDGQLYRSLIFGNGTHVGVPSAAYYIRGLAHTAYTLGSDDPIGAKCIQRLEELLENIYDFAEYYKDDPKHSGLYVPPSAQNWVDKQEVGEALQCVYEYTGNKKALELLENYHKWLHKDLQQNSMAGNWEGARKADIFDSAVWIYNNTDKKEIKETAVEVMRLITEQAIDWEDIMSKNEFNHYNFFTRHIVNVTQGLKEPIMFYMLNKSEETLENFYIGFNNLIRDHGRIDGLINGSEQLSGKSTIEAVETCAVVEMIKSLNRAFQVTGDIDFADRIEVIGYNSLPASFSEDMKSISYFTPTNLVQISKGDGMGYTDLYFDGNPGYTTDADEDLGLGPHPACHCCSVNCHIGYPEFINSMYYATSSNGVLVALYGPSEAAIKVGSKAEQITIKQTTNYPFEDVVNISFSMPKKIKFPLQLRIPEWAKNMTITLNGKQIKNFQNGEIFTINRTWSSDDVLSIDFNPTVTESRWANNSIGVSRGSLVFSLYFKENKSVRGVAGTTFSGKTYYDYDVYATSDWNYGLVLEKNNFADNFEVTINTKEQDSDYNYYLKTNYENVSSAPIFLKTKAAKIDSWKINDINMIAQEVPVSPVVSTAPIEEVYLIPFGVGELKLANFPEISLDGKDSVDTKEYSNDFSQNILADFLYYGPSYNISSKGFGTYFKINYGSEVINENDKENAWGSGAFNPKAILDNHSYKNFTLETTITAKGTSIDNYGVIFRATAFSHSRHGFLGYYAAIDKLTDELYLYKTDANFEPAILTKTSLKAPISIISGAKLKIVCNETNIKIYINNDLLIDVNDNSYVQGGQVGFVVQAFDFMIRKNQISNSAGKLDLAYAVKNISVNPQ